MSWEGILHSLLSYKCINQAALAGRDGQLWSWTPGFQPTQQEILALVSCCDGESNSPASFTLAGRRYLTLRRINRCIDGKFSQDVATVALSHNCVIIAAYVASNETPLVPPPEQQQQQQQHRSQSQKSSLANQCQPNQSEKVHLAVANMRDYLQQNQY